MKSKNFVCLLSIVAASGLLTTSVFAAWAVTDNAEPFGVRVALGTLPCVATFHLPDQTDNTCVSFTETNVDVNYGQTIDSDDIPSTDSFLSFSFVSWYSDSSYEHPIDISSYVFDGDADFYAKFTRTNVLLGSDDKYYTSSNSDQTVTSQYLYRISSQTWGVAPTKQDVNKIDLLSTSGIYKMTYSSNWSILRKVGANVKNINWWGNDSSKTYVYGQTSDTSSYGKRTWGGVLSSAMQIGTSSFASNQGTAYIDYSKSWFGICRGTSGSSSNLDLGNDSSYSGNNRIYNECSTKTIGIDGYSKDSIYLYLWDNYLNEGPGWGASE